jgi:signal transduction histidine kinase
MNARTLAILILITAGSIIPAAGQTPVARDGVLDLRNIERKDKFAVNLNGTWEFYWNQMLYPNDFRKIPGPKPDIFADVPAYWTDYKKRIPTTWFGYATYRLTILLPEGVNKKLALEVPVFDSSFDLWINDSLIFSNGIPGRSEDATIPGYRPGFMRYTPTSDSMSILINVANFHHRRGGFWLPLRLGTFNQIQKDKAARYAGAYSTVSLLFGFAVFFLIFFFLYPKDRIHGFFGLALLGIAIRPLFTSGFLIYDFFDLSWIWTIRLEYISLYMILGGMLWFTDHLYPSRFIRIIATVLTPLFLLTFILTMVLPVKYFSYATQVIYPALLILFGYSLTISFLRTLRKKKIEAVYLAAFLLLAFGAIHDVLVSLGKSHGSFGYVMSFVVIVFIFLQAILLLYKWVYAYYEKEKLQVKLEFMNRNLEEMISKRTMELQHRTEEIEKQNVKIASQNKQLSDTIQLKNKIFSVISHDLRSPVVNILYMLNLLKEEEYKEKYDEFANSSIQYAQMVINLLENMLVWGRGQEEKIKYSPSEHDLASIILTNLSIFKETADRKDISVNFTQKGNSIGYFDKDLMDIVIRNILSNAVKYTPRGGRISILVKDKSNEGGGIMLKICDNGIGIPETKQKYLFTLSEIESTPGTEDEKGTGLGLKLCYELVKINRGTISIESKEGEGTCFIIALPQEKTYGAAD